MPNESTVYPNWSTSVFKSTYNTMPCVLVGTFLKRGGHCRGVSSFLGLAFPLCRFNPLPTKSLSLSPTHLLLIYFAADLPLILYPSVLLSYILLHSSSLIFISIGKITGISTTLLSIQCYVPLP